MFRRSVVVVVFGVASLLGACGSSSEGGNGISNIAEGMAVAVSAPAMADDAACVVDRQMLETASEYYLTLNGTPPPNQQALVDAEIISELSPRFEITPEGVVVPAPGSPCV
jgi:uncharacterized protein (UPF0333 family)